MPIYEYKCTNGHQFEVMQRMSEDAVTACEVCDASVQRVFHPVAVHFKGSGFYNTDYGTRRRSREAAEAGDSKGSDGGSKNESNGSQTESTKSDSGKSDSGKSDSGKSKSDSGKSGSSTTAAAAAD